MKSGLAQIACAAALAGVALVVGSATAKPKPVTTYTTTVLTADQPSTATAAQYDSKLVNPWGIAYLRGNDFWIADNGSGLTTLYNPAGADTGSFTIPPPAGVTQASPTGVVANTDKKLFLGDVFIFASEDGIISGWQGAPSAVKRVDNSTNPSAADSAVYKGITISESGKGAIFVSNFRAGTIEEYDGKYKPVTLSSTDFVDSNTPAGYAPFNLKIVGNALVVTYALQDAAKHDDVAANGNGFVDSFTLKGKFLKRLISGSNVVSTNGQRFINSPWGLATAPSKFGTFKKALLIGQFGNGWIFGVDPSSGKLLGFLTNSSGSPLVIRGLWSLIPGGGGNSGNPNDIYFTAGPNSESNGEFGTITPNS